MTKEHHYSTRITWTGNQGTGTSDYKTYSRNHTISTKGKPDVLGSSDASFRGDTSRYSPEDSFVAACAACHMLWYLHLCAVNDVVVETYVDEASAVMMENKDGSGQFIEIVLKPIVVVHEQAMVEKALSLHHDANTMCFLARSVNFPIRHKPIVQVR